MAAVLSGTLMKNPVAMVWDLGVRFVMFGLV